MAHGLLRLRFGCSGCGRCCRDLHVPLTLADARRLPASAVAWRAPHEVDMTGEPESFVILPEGRRVMMLARVGGVCVFLRDDRCSVHAQRPAACRLYPFDVSTGRKGGIRRLRVLQPNLCTGDTQGFTNPVHLAQQHAAHRAELEAHVAAVQTFNRRQRRRRRAGLGLLSADAFLFT